MENLTQYSCVPIRVKLNGNEGYQGIQNTEMAPYIVVGFIPSFMSSRGATQGWKAAGKEIPFSNCDANPNSYIAFLFNPNNVPFISYVGDYNSLMFAWYEQSSTIPLTDYIPDEFRSSQYENHHGGC